MIISNTTAPSASKPPSKQVEPKDELHLDQIPVSADTFTAGAVGAGAGLVDGLLKAPSVAWETLENTWQSEEIGPSLKPLALLASPVVAAVNTIAAPIWGAGKFAEELSENHPPGEGIDKTAQLTKGAFQAGEFSSADLAIEKLEAMGDSKLEPGELPADIPLTKPVFALAGGVLSSAVGGALGLAVGLKSAFFQASEQVAEATLKEDLTLAERIGLLADAPIAAAGSVVSNTVLGLRLGIQEASDKPWAYGGGNPMDRTAGYFF